MSSKKKQMLILFISQPKNMIIYPTVQQILISKKPDI